MEALTQPSDWALYLTPRPGTPASIRCGCACCWHGIQASRAPDQRGCPHKEQTSLELYASTVGTARGPLDERTGGGSEHPAGRHELMHCKRPRAESAARQVRPATKTADRGLP